MVRYKEGKRFEVVKATTKNMNGVKLDGQEYEFGANGSFMLSDPGAAREIEKEYGHREGSGDVVVSPVTIEEPGHKYTFSGVDTSHIRTTRDNGYVWVRKGGNQVRVKRETALAEGWQIVKQKRSRRANVRREVRNGL